MSSSAETSLLLAALVWDVPNLRSSGRSDAQLFLDVMNFAVPAGQLEEPPQTPLGLAAVALAQELTGRWETAHVLYQQLADLPGEARLAGLLLKAWSATQSDRAILAPAVEAIEEVPDRQVRARLCSKLVAAALSHHWDEDITDLLIRAIDWAVPESALHQALVTEGYNLGLPRELPLSMPNAVDPLVHYDWVTALAEKAMMTRLGDEVLSRARSPWSFSFTLGRRDADALTAAYVQAEWAGAIWLLRDLRLRLANQTLLGPPVSPRQTADAVVGWALGGGRSVEAVQEFAEASFDEESADQILREVDRKGPLRDRLVWTASELMVALWDLVSVELGPSYGAHAGHH